MFEKSHFMTKNNECLLGIPCDAEACFLILDTIQLTDCFWVCTKTFCLHMSKALKIVLGIAIPYENV